MLFWALLASGQITMRKVDAKAAFVTRLQSSQLPDQIARQLPGLPTNS